MEIREEGAEIFLPVKDERLGLMIDHRCFCLGFSVFIQAIDAFRVLLH